LWFFNKIDSNTPETVKGNYQYYRLEKGLKVKDQVWVE